MKFSRYISGLFLFISLALMGLALVLVMSQPGTPPTLLSPAHEAQDRVTEMMDTLCQGDFTATEQYLLGSPSLGVDREPADAAGALVWDAFIHSFSYTLSGDCYATNTGVAQNVTLTYLDIPAVTANLAQRSEKYLAKMQEEATYITEIYDEAGNYRTDVVLKVLNQAVEEALKEDVAYTSATFALQLEKRNGQWYIIPSSEFIRAISGGM